MQNSKKPTNLRFHQNHLAVVTEVEYIRFYDLIIFGTTLLLSIALHLVAQRERCIERTRIGTCVKVTSIYILFAFSR